jgi:O-antigen/teichoic acid export membrane protein
VSVSSVRRPPAVLGRRSAATNLVALGLALGCVTLASLLVARLAGPAVLGEYTLLRILPWLTGVVLSCGLPVASTYFLGAAGHDRRLRPTLALIAVAGSVVGLSAWLLGVPLLHAVLFPGVPLRLLALSGVLVVTQLLTVWGKACCQGVADMRGANLVIVGEEFLFLPGYAVALFGGLRGLTAVVAGMVGGGLAAVVLAMVRNAGNGFFRAWGRPSAGTARDVVGFGARGQLGDLLWLVNLRFDFLVLGALAGPAVLGNYAVASKCAELMRMPATAVNYVLYPRFTRLPRAEADVLARRLTWRAGLLTTAAAPVMAVVAAVALPLVYGSAFRAAVVPACVLLIGLAVEGAAAVSSAYLRGVGRPGTNSAGMAAGVLVTVTLDILLIPRYHALGAAVASTVAYLVTTAVLVVTTYRCSRPDASVLAPVRAGDVG